MWLCAEFTPDALSVLGAAQTIVALLVCGLGFGGYSSVKEIVVNIDTFGVFSPCYGC